MSATWLLLPCCIVITTLFGVFMSLWNFRGMRRSCVQLVFNFSTKPSHGVAPSWSTSSYGFLHFAKFRRFLFSWVCKRDTAGCLRRKLGNHEGRDVEDSYDGTGEGAVDGRSLMCADKFRIEKRRRRRSLTTVDVESATVLRRRQSPRNERPSVSSSRSANSVNETSAPTLLPSFGQTSKEFHFARVGPDEQQQGEEEVVVAPVTTKRRESAPDLNGAEPADSRPRIIIRLTSVDGLEFSLSSPVQDNLLQPTSSSFCPVRTVRVGAARPQNSMASGPKGSSKDDSTFDYTPTANGEYTGSETLTIMRRSSSKRKSQRAGAGTPSVTELDDSALERHVGIVEDETPMEIASATVPSSEICENASLRLKCLLRLLDKGEVRPEVMQKNLKLAIQVLDAVYIDEAGRRTPEEDDDLSEVRADAVPPEVRAWLASTFTRQISSHRKPGEEKPKFRSVAQAIRAGILVERIYRRMSSSSFLQFPAEVARNLKLIDEWTFDVFALSDVSAGSPLRYLGIDLLNRYGVIHKFKIPSNTLESFLNQTEAGYCKHRNLYHNNTHAADVTQTLHYVLYQTGLMNWLTDLEIFAAIIAAIIHDFEHTGTTNSFHVMSGSETALLYNDRSVQENHHISAAFRLMREEDCNILVNLSREEFREFRSLVIDMVLATDMSCHFQQIKAAKGLLTVPELSVDKSKILSLVLHCCDVAHPSKPWLLHRHWTDLLLEEFFQQGDNEKELGLPYSPLCDRNNTLVAESQIGFIEFIVEPTMAVMGDLLDKILIPLRPQSAPVRNDHRDSISEEKCDAGGEVVTVPTTPEKAKKEGSHSKISGEKITRPWDIYLEENKGKWKELSIKDQQRRQEEAKLKPED
ncbi:calcium/calmodulin-dependent 3',5'-cyclic nucleotide phosphodiesterase 1B-like isoform X2 [Daphnia pulex]|uniref:calcium/calmodulin-dependent 3',5'-cyclic nucleotide phosphodiesterase 1B-like isoform X2 n=1 Tax=Daphnia pulex TaxID=6669 RepID=UPI001EDD2D14|nr:calcium/calmodulin-dependent 3',5'-cyclic nucleotide phosphodiesterase 1B-like isoform X2 [Daphnia pulex]